MSNRRIVLASRPSGAPTLENFRLEDIPVPTATSDGEFVVKVEYLSVDPYMRGRMSDSRKSYAPPQPLNEVMTGGAVGQVIESRNGKFATGDIVQGQFGWQEYALSTGAGVVKVDPSLAPISTSLGILGMPRYTAACFVVFVAGGMALARLPRGAAVAILAAFAFGLLSLGVRVLRSEHMP